MVSRFFSRGLKTICDVEMVISILSLILLVSINIVEIFRRVAFGKSFIWIQEITILLLLWFTFMGFGKMTYDKKDIYIDFFVRKMPLKIRQFVKISVVVVALLFAAIYAYYAFLLVIKQIGQTTVVARYPISLKVLAPTINGITLVLINIDLLRDMIVVKKRGGEA